MLFPSLRNAPFRKVARGAMPLHWDWPQDPPLKITARAKSLANFDDVWDLPLHPEPDDDHVVDIELVPYGCAKVFKVSMFPYVGA